MDQINLRCRLCNNPISREEFKKAYRLAETWTRSREGGGEHGLVCPKYLNVWAHENCVYMDKLKMLGQARLFA